MDGSTLFFLREFQRSRVDTMTVLNQLAAGIAQAFAFEYMTCKRNKMFTS